ncbi:PQQ-binding-like beta-propeller repeat protein [Arcicella rigui]|uniref:Uncharacterized protein n=1 Tax=Arcicella rigui TaxID=797020 RepID=A0ABU5QA13_9BACT|nr:hypothetical protein [Arcicella rigui]MEA5139661.1 hypothetical protein [Arcicella rigui]
MKILIKHICNNWNLMFISSNKLYLNNLDYISITDYTNLKIEYRIDYVLSYGVFFSFNNYVIFKDSNKGCFLIQEGNIHQVLIDNIKVYRPIIVNENGIAYGTYLNFQTGGFWVDLNSKQELWKNREKYGLTIFINQKNEIFQTSQTNQVCHNNFLTGKTLWERSFNELGIVNLDKFIGDINNILICACGKTILGLDKNTGEELWRVNHYTEVANAVLNQASGYIYLFYGWSGPENNFSENDNITFIEIDALTGEVLYDNSIFKHPNYIELNGLRHYEGTGDYPRFQNALQWKHKIYFIINSWHSSMVKIMEFDTVNKRISYLTEQSYEANANSNWFIAEGKLFIQSRISQQIESEENPDPLYWSKIYSKSQFDGEHMQYQHFAISKESYLTIFDLEDN